MSQPIFAARLHYTEPMLRRVVRTFVLRRALRGWLAILAGALLIAGIALALEGSADLQLGFVTASLFFLIVFIVIVWRAHFVNTIRRFRAMDPREGEMVAADRDITFSSTLGSSTIPWTRFTEVWELSDCWMLFTAPNQFITLPLAGLDEPSQAFLRSKLPKASS